MKDVFAKTLKTIIGNGKPLPSFRIFKKRPLKQLTKQELVQLESQIGSKLFGPITPGRHRDFFKVDEKNWVWHEEWTDQDKKKQSTTVKYEIHPDGILKIYDSGASCFIDDKELQNFSTAVQAYYECVMRDIYKRDPRTGKPLN